MAFKCSFGSICSNDWSNNFIELEYVSFRSGKGVFVFFFFSFFLCFFFFWVNVVFGWMPHHNLLQKMEHIDTSCYQLQCWFAVMAASLFLDFCFIVPDVASQKRAHKNKKKKLQKKRTCLLFIWPLILHLLLFCIGPFAFLIERVILISVRNAKWLGWICWSVFSSWGYILHRIAAVLWCCMDFLVTLFHITHVPVLFHYIMYMHPFTECFASYLMIYLLPQSCSYIILKSAFNVILYLYLFFCLPFIVRIQCNTSSLMIWNCAVLSVYSL